jgi:hypothetical protein
MNIQRCLINTKTFWEIIKWLIIDDLGGVDPPGPRGIYSSANTVVRQGEYMDQLGHSWHQLYQDKSEEELKSGYRRTYVCKRKIQYGKNGWKYLEKIILFIISLFISLWCIVSLLESIFHILGHHEKMSYTGTQVFTANCNWQNSKSKEAIRVQKLFRFS